MIKIMKYGEVSKDEIFARGETSFDVADIVTDIIENVKQNGDKALFEYAEKFDKAKLSSLEVTEEEIEEAFNKVEPKFIEIIKTAAQNIRNFHEKQVRNSFIINEQEGIVTGQKVTPIEKVGLYVPGGTAAYPSTVLMDSIPAKIAGCSEICIATPPSADGKVNPVILAAAKIAGVDRIFKMGGAQAIAAMAYGTESVPKVLKIFGPGNQFVTMAKRIVSNDAQGASIDMPAGPSEVLVIASDSANPEYIAADLLSQAEHGPDSQVILIALSQEFANKVMQKVDEQLEALPRKEIALKALSKSTALVVDTLDEAAELSNRYAPEHLILQIDDPDSLIGKLRNAGSIFVGAYTPESLGDYASGTNHTLPTYGYAKTFSALGTDDYRRRYTIQRASKEGLKEISKTVTTMASAEGLDAHRNAVVVRVKDI